MRSLRAREVFENGELSVIAMESVTTTVARTDGSVRAFASIEPGAIVVLQRGSVCAFDVEGEVIDLPALRQASAELDRRIREFEGGVARRGRGGGVQADNR